MGRRVISSGIRTPASIPRTDLPNPYGGVRNDETKLEPKHGSARQPHSLCVGAVDFGQTSLVRLVQRAEQAAFTACSLHTGSSTTRSDLYEKPAPNECRCGEVEGYPSFGADPLVGL